MRLQLHTTLPELEALADRWNPLLAHAAVDLPFLRYEYLRTWWDTLGAGEWSQGDLRVVTAHEGETLVGIAPFFRTLRGQRPLWMLIGSQEISDYLDLIALPEAHLGFCEQILALAASQPASECGLLDLHNLRAASPTPEAMAAAARRLGWQVAEETLHPCPVIALPDTWESYLEGLERKQRHEIRRKLRRGEGDDEQITRYLVGAAQNLEAETEAFLDLMAADERKAAFLTPAMRAHFRRLIRAGFQAGWMQLAVLEVDGEKAAAYLSFDYLNRIWVYNSGLAPRFAALSPGWILLGFLIRWAIDHRRSAFDFMRGNEPYKSLWGGVSEPLRRLTLTRPLP